MSRSLSSDLITSNESAPAATTSWLVRSSAVTITRSRSAVCGCDFCRRSTRASIIFWISAARRGALAFLRSIVRISRYSGATLRSRFLRISSTIANERALVEITSELRRSSGTTRTLSSARMTFDAICWSNSCTSIGPMREALAFSSGYTRTIEPGAAASVSSWRMSSCTISRFCVLPTSTSELVGRSGRITSCANGTNTSLSIAAAGLSPCGWRAMRMRPICFCSGPLSGSLVEPSTSTARSVSARSRASAYCSLTMRGSIQPSATAESSRSRSTSTNATASSLPATITVLVRSSTEIATSCASAWPVAPAACALTCVPVRPPICLPCAKSSRTMRENCVAWMFCSG